MACLLAVITLPPGCVRSIVTTVSIGLSVFMYVFVRLHISKTTWPNFTKFSVYVTCGRGSDLVWRHIQYLMHFRLYIKINKYLACLSCFYKTEPMIFNLNIWRACSCMTMLYVKDRKSRSYAGVNGHRIRSCFSAIDAIYWKVKKVWEKPIYVTVAENICVHWKL